MKNNSSEKPGSFWEKFFAIVSIAIAVGAYSGDSIMVRLFKSDDVYRVVSSGYLAGESQYYALIKARNKPILIPISALVHFSVRNDSNQDQIVESLGYEVMTKNNDWLAVNCIPIDSQVFEVENNNFQHAGKADFGDNNLLENLGKGVIKPKQVISGWLLIKYPHGVQDSLMYEAPARINLHSGFGENEEHDVNGMFYPEKVTRTRSGTILTTVSEYQDISKIPVGDFYGH